MFHFKIVVKNEMNCRVKEKEENNNKKSQQQNRNEIGCNQSPFSVYFELCFQCRSNMIHDFAFPYTFQHERTHTQTENTLANTHTFIFIWLNGSKI